MTTAYGRVRRADGSALYGRADGAVGADRAGLSGSFVTFEGPEGSGKSTQIERLAASLGALGHDVLATREPGGTLVGESVRELLLDATCGDLEPVTELLLFCAARAQLVRQVVAPALTAGRLVLCDRYMDATMAYQGYGRGVDKDWIDVLNRAVVGPFVPDLTVLLDLPVEEGLARRRATTWNRLDAAGEEFHRRVRQGYLTMARSEPGRWVVVAADAAPDQVAQRILDAVQAVIRPASTSGPDSSDG